MYYETYYYNLSYVKSTVDNKLYLVRKNQIIDELETLKARTLLKEQKNLFKEKENQNLLGGNHNIFRKWKTYLTLYNKLMGVNRDINEILSQIYMPVLIENSMMYNINYRAEMGKSELELRLCSRNVL